MDMTVKELIKQLQEIENKDLKVFVNSFADIGSGWSESISDFKVIIRKNEVFLGEE